MNAVHDIWRQLTRRRLLPVAVLLAAALVAVPVVLARGAAPAPAPDLKPVDDSAAAATKTIVSLAAADAKRHAVKGARTNPFAGEQLPAPKQATAPTTSTTAAGGQTAKAAGTSAASTPGSGGGSGSAPASAPATSAPAPATTTTPAAPKPSYAKGDLSVRFGDAAADTLVSRTLKPLEPLPSSDDPVLVYVGLTDKGKTAKFLIPQGVTVNGDGRCEGAESVCDTVELRAGETEFFDVTDETGQVSAQYELDLVKIHQ
jgi:hypothetical protein